VHTVICAAADVHASKTAHGLADRYENVYCTAGVHPHDAKSVDAGQLQVIKRLAQNAKCVAVGEIGLDYHYDFSPREDQRRAFAEQLALADELSATIVIHTREAIDDTLAVLAESGVDGGRLVFHSCTESADGVVRMLDLGAMVSFSGIVTFKKTEYLRESARLVPDDRLLIETDAPYLSPEPVRKIRPNEPAHVAHVAACLARVRDLPPDDLAAQTAANARRFFGWDAG
jgi:TatD DNase family protein